jgi:hypothetical protein
MKDERAAKKSAVFNLDGRRVVTALDDHTARLWEAERVKLSSLFKATRLGLRVRCLARMDSVRSPPQNRSLEPLETKNASLLAENLELRRHVLMKEFSNTWSLT